MRKEGSVQTGCGLGKKQIMGDVVGRKPWIWRKVRENGVHRNTHNENTYAKPLARKMRGADSHEFLQPVGLKHWSFIGQWAWLR